MSHVDEVRGRFLPQAPLIGDHEHARRLGERHEVGRFGQKLHVPPVLLGGGGVDRFDQGESHYKQNMKTY